MPRLLSSTSGMIRFEQLNDEGQPTGAPPIITTGTVEAVTVPAEPEPMPERIAEYMAWHETVTFTVPRPRKLGKRSPWNLLFGYRTTKTARRRAKACKLASRRAARAGAGADWREADRARPYSINRIARFGIPSHHDAGAERAA